jgi:hypothetical protein
VIEDGAGTVNLVGLFKGTATWSSPRFTVPVDTITGAEVRLERAFDPGGLVELEPEATFVVTLADLSTGTSTTVLDGELGKGDEAFAPLNAPVAVIGGHISAHDRFHHGAEFGRRSPR